MATYVVKDNAGNVVNVIEWDGVSDHDPGEGHTVVVATPELLAQFGPVIASAAATPVMIRDRKLSEGLAIISTGTPALNGTYAIDGTAQANITAIYVGIKGGDGLPGGGNSFVYLDMEGSSHTFNEATFVDFAIAARDRVYALQMAALQPTPNWPAASVVIP